MIFDRLDHTALDRLRAGFAGEIILPDSPDYDSARTLFNAMIDKHPAVIAQCATPGDVTVAVHFGRERSLEIAVRGGGHSVAGKALAGGGLVIDLRRMNEVVVNPDERTATVGGGATMGDLDRATEPYGLATTGGRVSTTGVGGFTLGVGSGWRDRKFGLAGARQRAGTSRALLGPARRWRQLRCRHRVYVPAASPLRSHRGVAPVAAGGGTSHRPCLP
jgi:hypothetical protein